MKTTQKILILTLLPLISLNWIVTPLLGWGTDDLRGYLAHPARLAFTLIVCLNWLVAIPLILRRALQGGFGAGIEHKRVKRQEPIRLILLLVFISFFYLIAREDRLGPGLFASDSPLRYLGLGLFVASLAMLWYSSKALGKQLSGHVTIQPEHELITHGPYRYIRHPRYLACIVLVIGITLIFRSTYGCVTTLLFSAILIFRIHDEELLLAREFGAEWSAYRERSWRLLPLLF